MKKNMVFLFILFMIMVPALLSSGAKKNDKKESELPGAITTGNSCRDCHSGLKGKLREPVLLWEKSVHAGAGMNCNICHGGNPEINDEKGAKKKIYSFIGKPNKKNITDFCGRGGCHRNALVQFKRGPHYTAVLKSYHPNCTDCHGVHKILRSSKDLINEKKCAECHPADYMKEIVKSVNTIETRIDEIDENIVFLRSKNAEVKDLEKKLDQTRHNFHQLVHVFSDEEIKFTKKIIESEIENLTNESKSKVALAKRLELLYIMMLVFGLITIAGFATYTIVMISRRR